MIWIKTLKQCFLILSILSAFLINFILFESIKKTLELYVYGIQTKAEVVNLEPFQLKFNVYNLEYKFEGQKPVEFSSEIGSEVDIVYNLRKPESAATQNQFLKLKSFLILLILVFITLLFSIYNMIRKVYLNLR